MKISRRCLPVLLLIPAALAIPRPAATQGKEVPFPPHRVAGNLYYVGTRDQASYLITSPSGHALINASFEESVPLIRASVEKLGFKFSDIKYLLNSHAHNDHCEGSAAVRKLTKARVLVMEGDEEIIRSGGKGDFQYHESWEPCPVDQVLHDKDTVKVGDTVLTARKTAGHTRGCTTWTMDIKDGAAVRHAVVIGSPNVNPGYKLVGNTAYPTIAEDYQRTFKLLKSLPCDLFLGAHGSYYDLAEKYAALQKNPSGNPFIDPKGYLRYVANREQAFRTELARQQGAQ
jgi:metallo-beta-lactamase class B